MRVKKETIKGGEVKLTVLGEYGEIMGVVRIKVWNKSFRVHVHNFQKDWNITETRSEDFVAVYPRERK